jgi:PQQ-like domain
MKYQTGLSDIARGLTLGWGLLACSSSTQGGTPQGDSGADSSVPDAGAQPFDGGARSEASTVDSGPDASDAGVAANVLISDQFNNRVIEVDPAGAIVWTFGDGTSIPGPTSVVAPNDAERLPNGQTLISGTGAPPGTEPTCPSDGGGCLDNRVLIVSADGGIVWQYGDDGGLNTPVASVYLPSGNVLITDQGNQRVIEVTPQKTIAWQYMPLTADGGPAFNSPNSAERLANGNTLITDENNNRVIEVTGDGGIAWQYPTDDAGLLSGAAFASRLDNGDTLITSANNATILEVDATGKLVWAYYTASRSLLATAPVVDGGNPAPLPTRAVRLANGHTLISDQFNNQVIEIDSAGNLISQFGQLNVAGNGPGQLNAPYDAKRIGDFTGLTSPQ